MDKSQMDKLENEILDEKYTQVYQDIENLHHYAVFPVDSNTPLLNVEFQRGPIKEAGLNGVMDEDLIAMVIDRLQGFQKTEYIVKENAMAITKLEEALLWLRKRTMEREKRGVEGTHTV